MRGKPWKTSALGADVTDGHSRDIVETRSLNYFAEACAGRLHGADAPVRRVCSDSRQLQAGDLFVALRGDRFDGHAFARESIRRGAVAAVVLPPKSDCRYS